MIIENSEENFLDTDIFSSADDNGSDLDKVSISQINSAMGSIRSVNPYDSVMKASVLELSLEPPQPTGPPKSLCFFNPNLKRGCVYKDKDVIH